MIKATRISFLLIAALYAGLFNGVLLAAGNPDAGKPTFQPCAECHGLSPDTGQQQSVPKLKGQHAAYILDALNAYADGMRKHAGMQRIAAALSRQQRENIAAWLGQFELKRLPIPGSAQASAAIATTIENCQVCHGVGGNSFFPDYPRINGQKKAYLIEALKSYKSGKRTNATMVYVVKNLSDQELDEIAAYYAGQKGGLTVVDQ